MSNVVVPMQLLPFFVLMSKNASLAIEANLLFVELTTVLGLIAIVQFCLHLHNSITLCKFLFTMSIVTVCPKSTHLVILKPVFAHFTLQPFTFNALEERNFLFFRGSGRIFRLKTFTFKVKAREWVIHH